MAGHLLALEDLAGLLALTGRTVRTVRDRHAVRRAETTEIVALHRTGKTLTLGCADNIDLLAGDEMAWRQGRTDLDDGVIRHAEFGNLGLRQHVRLGEVTAHGLRDVFRLGRACTELQRRVAVALAAANGHDLNVVHLQNGHRNVTAGVVEDPCHAQLASNYSATHWSCPFPRA